MARRTYLTVPEELVEHADAVADYLDHHGYVVTVEPAVLSYPYTPTLRAKRAATTLLIETDSALRRDRAQDWIRYAHSCTQDTRFGLAVPERVLLSGADEVFLRASGAGLYVAGPTNVAERIPPIDLAVNVQLPDLRTLPRRTRRLLGSAYEQFERSHWREGFEDACQALESEARLYLKRRIAGGILVVNATGRHRPLTARQVDRMTLGQLAGAFAFIQTQNYTDALLAKVLSQINMDRIGVVHRKGRAATERRLRANVGQHMWTIIRALKEMH